MRPKRRGLSAALLGCTLTLAALAANAEAPAVSPAAPRFKLQDQTGKTVSLDEHKGKWVVLHFYPKDNTPGCTTQACEFRDNIFAFRDAGALILGISVDDVASHRKFAEQHSLPFTILSDASKETARAHGVLYKAMGLMELARRETFISDPQGRIAKHYPQVNPKGHSQLVLTDLKTLKAG